MSFHISDSVVNVIKELLIGTMKLYKYFVFVLLLICAPEISGFLQKAVGDIFRAGVLDLNFFRCIIKGDGICPHPDVVFHMYTPKNHKGMVVSVRNPLKLYAAGFDKHRETAFIIHGFNGTERDKHIMYLRDAFVFRDYNVITVDWRPLTRYPCYLTALANTQLAAQCTAQLYAFLTHNGVNGEQITCAGHSLGAHVCGMVSNYLTTKQHKIIGMDPARPLIERAKSTTFRLTRDDAHSVQILHTNAGFLGQSDHPGHLNYCINGGRYQPYCKGHAIRRSRCSHFLSICYLANAMFKNKKFIGVPCPGGCVGLSDPNSLPVSSRNINDITSLLRFFKIGIDAEENLQGVYCLKMEFAKHCPFNT